MTNSEYYLKKLEERWSINNNKNNSFKRLILLMHENFPNFRVSEKAIKEIIVTSEDREFLSSHGFFLREKASEGYDYGLGPAALPLVSAWKTEELNKRILILTLVLVGLGLIQTIFILWQMFL